MNEKMRVGEPVYAVIAEALKKRIISGEEKPGNLLPSENELAGRYSASRETVRKGLKLLENDGYIVSRPGKGYFVSLPEYDRFQLTFSESEEESVLRHIDVKTPNGEVAEALGLTGRKKVIEIIRLIYRSKRPVAYELRYYPYDRGKPTIESAIDYAVFPQVAAAKTSAFAFHTRMEISAVSAYAATARLLGCREGEALLLIRRYLIGPEDTRIGYSMKFALSDYGPLHAASGVLLG